MPLSSSPWNDEQCEDVEAELNVSSESISPGTVPLGPIGPPSRKPINASPQQGSPQSGFQTPPITKSPLLGTAPGLLPLPDKSRSMLCIVFVLFYSRFCVSTYSS